MYHNGKKVSERVEEMIIVNIDLKDKEFEKRLGRALSGSFTVNLSENGSEGNILITDYDAESPAVRVRFTLQTAEPYAEII